jgi:hypothetical protein
MLSENRFKICRQAAIDFLLLGGRDFTPNEIPLLMDGEQFHPTGDGLLWGTVEERAAEGQSGPAHPACGIDLN